MGQGLGLTTTMSGSAAMGGPGAGRMGDLPGLVEGMGRLGHTATEEALSWAHQWVSQQCEPLR